MKNIKLIKEYNTIKPVNISDIIFFSNEYEIKIISKSRCCLIDIINNLEEII